MLLCDLILQLVSIIIPLQRTGETAFYQTEIRIFITQNCSFYHKTYLRHNVVIVLFEVSKDHTRSVTTTDNYNYYKNSPII